MRKFFHIFAAMAEFERDLIRERTQAGLAAARAKARGRMGGRPSKLTEAKILAIRKLYADKNNQISGYKYQSCLEADDINFFKTTCEIGN